MNRYPCPVVGSTAAYIAAESRAEIKQLAIEHEAEMLLATPEGRREVGRRLIEELDAPSVYGELEQMLGDLIAAAKDGREVGRIDQLYPCVSGWALAQVEKHAEEIVMEEAA